eukprot:XP_024998658.1 AP-3 complex subunit mu-2 isoform X2 [Gallus gallus]
MGCLEAALGRESSAPHSRGAVSAVGHPPARSCAGRARADHRAVKRWLQPLSLCKLLSHCGEKHLLTFRTKHDPSASSLEADRPRSCSSKQWCNFKFPSTGASEDYFGVCSEVMIKDNVVVVYEVLEEMLDNGFPLATESNILKELIKPPTILRTVVNTITGSTNVGDQLPTGQLSVVPWRRTGVKYTNNEAYFDVIEEIDAIIDKSGSTITAEIQGVIDACVKLTGMPDLTLSFMNPRLLDDVSFHPCVRFKRWESERILSFIPPDGNFRLLSYHVSAQNLVAIPVYVKHNINFRDSSSLGRFEITVGPKQTMGKTVEGVMVTSQMPKGVLNMSLTPSQGTHIFDPVTKVYP